jgi:hypothetical protein
MAGWSLAVALLIALSSCGNYGAPPLALFPPEEHGTVAIALVVRAEDCLSCFAVDYALRQAMRQPGAPAHAHVYVVGHRRDVRIVEDFLHRRRVPSRTYHMTEREARQALPGVPIPSLHLVAEGLVRWSSPDSTGSRSNIEELGIAIVQLAAREDDRRGSRTGEVYR